MKKNKKKSSKRGKTKNKKKSLHCSSKTINQKNGVKRWTMKIGAVTVLIKALVQLFHEIKYLIELITSISESL